MAAHGREGGTTTRRVLLTVAAVVLAGLLIFFALRAIPSAQRPSLGPVPPPTSVGSAH